MKLQNARFHFVGIGGIGMCGLAELLHNMGAQVSGSDLSDNANTERLKELGIRVDRGHAASQVGDADVVVYSSAVKSDNPEVLEARKRRIPLIQRAEALAEIMRLKRGLTVAGTHGKTTTTSLVASIFLQAQLKPTIVVGGRFGEIKSTALLGEGEWLIAEADESDGSFHRLTPEIAIITNIDSDHLDHFKTFENLEKSFFEFALKIPFYGQLVVWGDDPRLKALFANYSKRILFYGFDESNDLVIKGQNGSYEIFEKTTEGLQKIGPFQLKIPGRHNALNSLAAFAAARAAGVEAALALKGLERFDGVDRRFQFKGEKREIRIYDDYGHHPTEVRATLQAFRERYPDRRLIVYFQPHRYSRTAQCWSDFTTCFALADRVLLGEIYPAGEAPIEGVDSTRLLADIKNQDKRLFHRKPDEIRDLIQEMKSGDIFVTLGAGDGWKLGMEILERL